MTAQEMVLMRLPQIFTQCGDPAQPARGGRSGTKTLKHEQYDVKCETPKKERIFHFTSQVFPVRLRRKHVQKLF